MDLANCSLETSRGQQTVALGNRQVYIQLYVHWTGSSTSCARVLRVAAEQDVFASQFPC